MTVQTPGGFNDAGSYDAKYLRQLIALLRGAGVIQPDDLKVSAHGTPNMTVDVAAGSAAVPGTEGANQGSYHLLNDAVLNVAITAANPTNPRRDLIVARIRDNAYGDGADDAAIVVVTGLAAPSPVDPATPANSLLLARVRVDAAVASIVGSKIDDLRVVSGMQEGFVQAQQATTGGGAYADMATPGPAITLYTGERAKISISAAFNVSVNHFAAMSFAVSGPTTRPASDDAKISVELAGAGMNAEFGRSFIVPGLTPGWNIFTAKYRDDGVASANIGERRILGEPL